MDGWSAGENGNEAVAVLGWGQGAQAPQILPRPPQIFDWFQGCFGGI